LEIVFGGNATEFIFPTIFDNDGDSWSKPLVKFGTAAAFAIGTYPDFLLKP
jgi:hypothetical protein